MEEIWHILLQRRDLVQNINERIELEKKGTKRVSDQV